MPIGFPPSPTLGQQWPVASPLWQFDGTNWVSIAGTIGAATPVTARLTSLVNTDDFIGLRASVPYLVAASVIADYVGAPPAATAPAALTVGQWSAAATSTPGEISFNISALPADGGSAITALEYRVGSGSAIPFTGTGTGVRVVTAGLSAGVAVDLQVRAVNAVDAGAWSDVKNRTPLAGGGGGSLTIVQAPVAVETEAGTVLERSLTAVGAGNHLIVAVCGSTSGGAPTITDSAGNSWAGTQVHSYAETTNNTTTYYFIKPNVTGSPTWVRATYATDVFAALAVVETSGSSPTLDGSAGGALQATAATQWDHAFTSSVANTLFVGFGSLSNTSTVTGIAPVTAATAVAGYLVYARGLFPTAGSNTASFTLNDVRTGAKSWIVVKG